MSTNPQPATCNLQTAIPTRRIRYASGANAEATLAQVPELSEVVPMRPARKLYCIPLQSAAPLMPVPAWKRRYLQIVEAFSSQLPAANS